VKLKPKTTLAAALAAAFSVTVGPAAAAVVQITVTAENLAPTDSVSFAPLLFGFNSGVYDAFNVGEAATAPIISVAEGGTGADWFPAFAAADPTAVLGSTGGPITPGGSVTSMTFLVDTAVNPYFTFGSMVVPSNDHFIGNDDPTEYLLFGPGGQLLINSIVVRADEIWNAGSEIFDPAAAAFLVGGNNDLRTAENGVVAFDFAELAGYDGLTTAAGYTFQSNLSADTEVFRISFSAAVVPEPATWAMMIGGFGLIGAAMRRRTWAPTAS
jgi:hypothetical protein